MFNGLPGILAVERDNGCADILREETGGKVESGYCFALCFDRMPNVKRKIQIRKSV